LYTTPLDYNELPALADGASRFTAPPSPLRAPRAQPSQPRRTPVRVAGGAEAHLINSRFNQDVSVTLDAVRDYHSNTCMENDI